MEEFTKTEEKTTISQETEETVAISQETEETVAISQETEKKSSQEIAETEEMKTIADEKADDEKTEKKEVNSEKTEEKTLSPEQAAKMAEKRKIIDKVKAPMEESRPEKAAKTEETEKNQKTAQVIAKGKAPMAEEEQLFEVNVECRDDDFDDFKDLYEEFLAEPNSESDSDEFNTAVGWSLAEDFFQKIGASNVYWNFRKALDSGNIEALSHDELEPHRPFAGILMIFGVHYHKKEKKKEVVLTILKEFMIGNGSKCDVIGFVNKYNVGEIHQAALQRAMFLVMYIHEEAGKVDEPANLVAEAFLDAYDTGIWGDEVFGTIYRFMRSPYKTLVVVGLVLATSLALVCKDRNSPELSKVIHQNKFAEVVHKMDKAKLEEEVVMRVTAYVDALEEMPKPLEEENFDEFTDSFDQMLTEPDEEKDGGEEENFDEFTDSINQMLTELDEEEDDGATKKYRQYRGKTDFETVCAQYFAEYTTDTIKSGPPYFGTANLNESGDRAVDLFRKFEGHCILMAYKNAIETGKSKNLDKELKNNFHGASWILTILCAHFVKNGDLTFVVDLLRNHVVKSEDRYDSLLGFSKRHKLGKDDLTLQRAVFHVTCFFDKVDELDVFAERVAWIIVTAFDGKLWGEEVIETLHLYLKTEFPTLWRVSFAICTYLAKYCQEKPNQELCTLIHKANIVATVREIMETVKLNDGDKKHAERCVEALGKMTYQS